MYQDLYRLYAWNETALELLWMDKISFLGDCVINIQAPGQVGFQFVGVLENITFATPAPEYIYEEFIFEDCENLNYTDEYGLDCDSYEDWWNDTAMNFQCELKP
eukprot:UN11067